MFPLRLALFVTLLASSPAQNGFVNWETPHVHPLERAPGQRLLAVNTPDDRLEVFDATDAAPVRALRACRSGSTRSRCARGANTRPGSSTTSPTRQHRRPRRAATWCATLATEDEPCDVVFAGHAAARLRLAARRPTRVLVFDPANLARRAARVAIEGEDPRALAVSPTAARSTSRSSSRATASTILGGGADPIDGIVGFPPNVVSRPGRAVRRRQPAAERRRRASSPPINPALPRAARRRADRASRTAAGSWMDDNGGDWTELVSGRAGRAVGARRWAGTWPTTTSR